MQSDNGVERGHGYNTRLAAAAVLRSVRPNENANPNEGGTLPSPAHSHHDFEKRYRGYDIYIRLGKREKAIPELHHMYAQVKRE